MARKQPVVKNKEKRQLLKSLRIETVHKIDCLSLKRLQSLQAMAKDKKKRQLLKSLRIKILILKGGEDVV